MEILVLAYTCRKWIVDPDLIKAQQEFGQTPCGLNDRCIILKIIEHTQEKSVFRCI